MLTLCCYSHCSSRCCCCAFDSFDYSRACAILPILPMPLQVPLGMVAFSAVVVVVVVVVSERCNYYHHCCCCCCHRGRRRCCCYCYYRCCHCCCCYLLSLLLCCCCCLYLLLLLALLLQLSCCCLMCVQLQRIAIAKSDFLVDAGAHGLSFALSGCKQQSAAIDNC